jgi:hypothetical protein
VVVLFLYEPCGRRPEPAHPLPHQFDRGVSARQRGRQLALGHHIQPVADVEQLFKLFAHHQHGATRVAQLQDFAANLRGSTHVNTPGGLRDDEQLGLGFDLAAHDELLQVAARQRLGHRLRPACLDLVVGNDAGGLRLQRAAVKPAAFAHRLFACEQQVACE